MPIQKVLRLSITDQVFNQLKEQLYRNEWKIGEKIPSENELTELFGVSRITVRQALQKLTALGLIETRLGEGSFVKSVTLGTSMNQLIPMAYLAENSLLEIIEFRRVMEGKVAELATKKATQEEIVTLEKAYKQMELVKDDLQKFAEADMSFHLILANMTKNSIIIQSFHIIQDVLRCAFSDIVSKRGNSAGLYYHKLLLEVVQSGNHLEAKRIMEEHMEEVYHSFNWHSQKEE